jgi:type I restriction enzyme S subunit
MIMGSKKKDEYKETMIGRIPKEWEVFKLKELVDVQGGKRLPKGDSLVDFETAHQYIRIVDFKNGSVDISDVKYLLPETYRKIKKYTISSKDVYISIAGTIGLVGLIPRELDGANLTENAAKLNNLKKVMKEYLVIVLNSRVLQNQIKRFTGKATQPKLALFRIEKLKIPVPSEKEQQKIAGILGTVDEAIEKVDKAIEKTERLKRGLMQELLTKGIGHKEFKDSKIGEISKEWEVLSLESANINVIDGDRGTNYPKQNDFLDEGYCLFLSAKNVTGNEFKFTENQFISKERDSKMSKGRLKKYDIVLTTRGTVGNVGFYDDKVSFKHLRINSGMVLLRNRNENIDNEFLYSLFKTPFLRTQIRRVAYGTAQPQLSVSIIKKLKIVVPSVSVQKKIVEILSTVDKKIDMEKKRKEKLEKIKKGLMQDLLTGRKRVKV